MMPSKLRAFCHFGKWHDIEVEDDVTCYCEYPNGATGVFITTTADAPGTNRFEVTGTKGTLIVDYDPDATKFNLYHRELEVDERVHCVTGKGFDSPKAKPTVKIEIDGPNPQHSGICNNIANAILGLEEVYAPTSDGLCGVQLANAMLLSTWLNKEIEIPFDDELFYEELKKRIAISKPHEVKNKEVTPQN
jgi:predicted dehydrogenase